MLPKNLTCKIKNICEIDIGSYGFLFKRSPTIWKNKWFVRVYNKHSAMPKVFEMNDKIEALDLAINVLREMRKDG